MTVNDSLEEVNHPIPKIEEIFTELEGGEEYTTLDLSEAYGQFEVDEVEESSYILA